MSERAPEIALAPYMRCYELVDFQIIAVSRPIGMEPA